MFTGIITNTGRIEKIENGQKVIFSIQTDLALEQFAIGASIAVDGICLTIIEKKDDVFVCEVIPETLRKTNLGTKEVGDLLNLETTLKPNQGLDGHIVLGHIDGTAEVIDVQEKGNDYVLRIQPQKELMKYISYKGSVAINGVSLTVSRREDDFFEVSLIAHTLQVTNMHALKKGSTVNIEVDIIARYLENLITK